MEQAVTVAVVRSDNRRGAVAQALALIAPDIQKVVRKHVLIKPNLVSHRVQPSTHADTLSAALDTMLALGADQVTVAEGASDASAGFTRFGYRSEARGRPVRFFDINREESEWETIELSSVRGTPLSARLSRTISQAECRVSLALAKTHVTSIVTFSLKNMLSSLHPADRVMMHGCESGGNGYSGWKRLMVELLKQDMRLVGGLTRVLGRLKAAKARWQGKNCIDGWRRLSQADVAFLRSVEAINLNLVALARYTRPHVSVVDGFTAMHREGPRHGTPIQLGTVIAGTDAVAVDAVAAAVMGFDPRQIGYLAYAESEGLGVADLDAITIVGDPIASFRHHCVPHSNFAVQRHWRRLPALTPPQEAVPLLGGPHARAVQTEKVARR